MKKLACSIVIFSILAGCSAAQIQNSAGSVAAVNGAAAGAFQTVAASIVAACPAGQAFLTAAAAATVNPNVVLAQDANGLFCAMNKAVIATVVQPATAAAPVAASQ